MRLGLILLAAGMINRETCMMLTAITMILLGLLQYMRTQPLELFYSKKNALFQEFVQKTGISKLAFQPYILAPTPAIQGLLYLFSDYVSRTYYREKPFTRELIKLPDGGTLGLDWDGPIPERNVPPKQPILVIFPGLAGNSDNLYSLAMLREARAAGFKCVSVLFRGASGVPLTSCKLNYWGAWEDVQHALEYVNQNYVRNK